MSETITVSAESVRDYQVCPHYYEHKYLLGTEDNIYGREQLAARFETTLKRVVSFFFYKRQGAATPSYNALLNRWEKLWFPKDMTAYDLAVERHESTHKNLVSYSNAATAALLQFHEDFSSRPGDPVLIDEKFLIPVQKEVRLEGVFDLILRHKSAYQVVRWSTKTKRPAISSLDYDFASQRMAFEYRNPTPEGRISYVLYDLGSTKPGAITVYPSRDDINALSFWINEIKNSTIFTPRRGFTSYCKGCPFDKPCSDFKFPTV